ncbi:unnamed protein product [Medioppia subpectinata]|uniref:Uncharacterized protein n=1 Tax=Medioppia subpectinata TaxID=1979941 RepID=A0A7R9L6J2_9ACAR|nr:unnamed protein product [Medioppia subpectinata]CAG2115354.1 unnamed protein product [Medioppia subpectinata]
MDYPLVLNMWTHLPDNRSERVIIEFKEFPIRVIVPQMPEFSLTRLSMAFWHSNDERSQFIRDFLQAINVTKIDCLVSHSGGTNANSKIWSDPQELTIGSICLFSPFVFWKLPHFQTVCRYWAQVGETTAGINAMDALRPDKMARDLGFMLSLESVDEMLLCGHFSRSDTDKLHHRLEYIRSHQIPTLLVHGERDDLVPNDHFQHFVRDLGATDEHIVRYSCDKNFAIESVPQSDHWIQVITFKAGGHLSYIKYSDIVNKHIVNHLLSK